MDDHLESVLDEAFPDRAVETVDDAGISWNDQNRTVRVDFVDGSRRYLKLAIDGDDSRITRERAAIAHVGAHGDVPVPSVVASDTDAAIPYLVTAPVSGCPLVQEWSEATASARLALARQVGDSLARVHALRFDHHGHIAGGADDLVIDRKPWTDVLVETIRETRTRAPSDRFDHHFDEVIAAVEGNRELLDDAPATLVHGDPAQPNCFVTDSAVGFLDWEIAHVGDPVRDLNRARSQQFDGLREEGPAEIIAAFYDGYRERAGGLPTGFEERRPVYEAVRFLGTSGYVDRMAAYVDEPVDEFVHWVDEEMERRLAKIVG